MVFPGTTICRVIDGFFSQFHVSLFIFQFTVLFFLFGGGGRGGDMAPLDPPSTRPLFHKFEETFICEQYAGLNMYK